MPLENTPGTHGPVLSPGLRGRPLPGPGATTPESCGAVHATAPPRPQYPSYHATSDMPDTRLRSLRLSRLPSGCGAPWRNRARGTSPPIRNASTAHLLRAAAPAQDLAAVTTRESGSSGQPQNPRSGSSTRPSNGRRRVTVRCRGGRGAPCPDRGHGSGHQEAERRPSDGRGIDIRYQEWRRAAPVSSPSSRSTDRFRRPRPPTIAKPRTDARTQDSRSARLLTGQRRARPTASLWRPRRPWALPGRTGPPRRRRWAAGPSACRRGPPSGDRGC